jgi:HEAT repeat protein
MILALLFKDKSIKSKQKTSQICHWLLDGTLPIHQLIAYAETAKRTEKATCIEGIEQASKLNANIVNEEAFSFVINSLLDKEPRVKWESARVIGNTVSIFKDKLDEAIKNLILNTSHEGTIVRWSAAYALGEIIKLKLKDNESLIKTLNKVCENEPKNSIKKIYLTAIKKVAK